MTESSPSMNPDYWEHARKERNDHWAMVKTARKNFPGEIEDFYKYLADQYGLKLVLSDGGFITDDFEIIDEHKYFLFVLKYGYGN